MTETTKSFKVPKIRRPESKDNLRQVELTSRDAKEILSTVKHSYLESNYVSQWQLKSVQFVDNKDLEEKYRLKKAEMKEEGRHARDLGEQNAFLLFRDNAVVPTVVKSGLKCKYLPFNALGDSKLGIYLCRNADVQLRLAEGWGSQTVALIVFKITPGKCKAVAGQVGDELIEPTPNFDCHVSQNQPKPSDPVHLQLGRSQVYLYEYTDECIPAEHPRHCLPYAVLVYEKLENPSRDSLQQKTDSYSKRPAPTRTESVPTDLESLQKSDLQNPSDTRQSRRETRLTSDELRAKSVDSRLGFSNPRQQVASETGLCVPRLTRGPPLSNDPRIQSSQHDQRLLQNSAGGNMSDANESPYTPSFGPRDVEADGQLKQLNPEQQQLQSLQQQSPGMSNQPYSNLPPNNLPSVTDPRLNRADPRTDTRLRDPRLQKLDNKTASDPLSTEPKVQHTSNMSKAEEQLSKSKKKLSLTDYKKKISENPVPKTDTIVEPTASSKNEKNSIYDDIRESQGISQSNQAHQHFSVSDSPVHQQHQALQLPVKQSPLQDPRIKPTGRDPRVPQPGQHLHISQTLQDPRLPKATPVQNMMPSQMPVQQMAHPPIQVPQMVPPPMRPPQMVQPPMQPPQMVPPPMQPPQMVPPPMQPPQMVPPPMHIPQMVTSPLQPQQMMSPQMQIPQMVPPPIQDPHIQQPEQTFYHIPPGSQPQYQVPPDQQQPVSTSSYPNPYLNTSQVDNSQIQTNITARTEKTAYEVTTVKSDELHHEDIVDGSDDMAKTLNELPDPDDASQSPIPMEVEEEDPALAEAMRKLVEHSGNVALFTEALKSLQESAEEMGDALTDPEFLVKMIAEKIEIINKAQTTESPVESDIKEDVDMRVRHNSTTSHQSEIQTIKSPDITESSTVNANNSNISFDIKIPFIPLENKNQEKETKDPGISESPMAKAMQKTLAELEKVEKCSSRNETHKYDNKPKSNEKKSKTNLTKSKSDILDIASIPIPPDIPKSNSLSDLKNTSVGNIPLPKSFNETQSSVIQNNSEETHNKEGEKSAVSFYLKKRGNSPETVAGVFTERDGDERDEKKSSQFLKQLKAREFKRETFKPVTIKTEPETFVPDERKVVMKFGKIDKGFAKTEPRNNKTMGSAFVEIEKDFQKTDDEQTKYSNENMDTDFRNTEVKKEKEEKNKFNDAVYDKTLKMDEIRTNVDDAVMQDKDERISKTSNISMQDVDLKQDLKGCDPRFQGKDLKAVTNSRDPRFQGIDPRLQSKDQNLSLNNKDTRLQGIDQNKDPRLQGKDQCSRDPRHQGKDQRSRDPRLQGKDQSSRDPRLQGKDQTSRDPRLQGKDQSSSDPRLQGKDQNSRDPRLRMTVKDENFQSGVDPAMLDRDERRSHSRSISPPTLNSAFLDRDERIGQQTNVNFVDPFGLDEEDRDDRIISRSQSGSPIPQQSKDKPSTAPGMIEKALMSSAGIESRSNDSQDSSDTGVLFDAYSVSKSSSTNDIDTTTEKKVLVPVENEFGDVDWRLAAAAEMGDVDLRASSSQNISSDTDLRQLPSVPSFGQGGPEQMQSFPGIGNLSRSTNSYYGTPATGYGHNFQHSSGVPGNQQVQNTSSVEQYCTTVSAPVDSYSTNKASYEAYSTNKASVASYSTSAAQFAGEYKTSGFQGNTYPDQYNYTSSGRCGDYGNTWQNKPQQSAAGGLQNVIQNVDMSHLKNILAIVQKPGNSGTSKPPTTTKPSMIAEPDSDEENKPAFCTGLSFLKSKQPKLDLARAKYTGFAKLPDELIPLIPGAKSLHPGGAKSGMDTSRKHNYNSPKGPKFGFDEPRPKTEAPPPNFCDPRGLYSNLDVTKQKEVKEPKEEKSSENQPFKFSEEIPERDITSFWHDIDKKTESQEIPGLKFDNNSDDKDEDSGSALETVDTPTPKSKTKSKSKKGEDLSTPQSYQNAILESMEQSALKVRHEDSCEFDEPAVKNSECVKSLFGLNEIMTQSNDSKSSLKRSLDDEEDTEKCRKLAKTLISRDADDTDDEETALVIDLEHASPMVKKELSLDSHGDLKATSSVEDQSIDVDDENLTIDLTNEEDRQTPVMDEKGDDTGEEDDRNKSEDEEEILQDEDVVPVKTNDDMQTFIEKTRKNMVIRLKGETKIVNPKTGKAYNESPIGSAIQVLGQPKPKPKPAIKQNPISVLHRTDQKRVVSPVNMPTAPLQQIHPIHGVIPIGGQPVSSKVLQFQSPAPSLISSIVSGATDFRSTSPVNQISTIGNANWQQQVHEYIHPYTGQKVTYGAKNMPSPTLQPVSVISQPLAQSNSFAGLPGVPLPNLSRPPPANIRSPFMMVSPVSTTPGGLPQFRMQPSGLISVVAQPRPQQPQGMAIQSLGTKTLSPGVSSLQHTPDIKMERKSSTDVFDWFSDKFHKREPDSNTEFTGSSNNVTVNTDTNYEFSSNSAIKVIRTGPENDSYAMRNTIQIDTGVDNSKRTFENDNNSYNAKKMKTEGEGNEVKDGSIAKVLDCHSIETLSKVKDVLTSTLANLNESSSASDTEAALARDAMDTDALSDLEEGEISDDFLDDTPESSPVKVHEMHPSNIQVLGARSDYSVTKMQTYGSAMHDSRRVALNRRPGSMAKPPDQQLPPGALKVASEWTDMLQNPDTRMVERVKATKIESMTFDVDTSSLVSKSAASITKTKQKIVARSQVKTLGDWLKVELETDNILPLQNIIPYSLNTDLTIISKQRRRKIRLKVKNAIEQEGSRKIKPTEAKSEPAKFPAEHYATATTTVVSRAPINPNYSPEVSGDQIDRELKLLKKYKKLNESRSQYVSNLETTGYGNSASSLDSVRQEELKLLVAMTSVETDMKTLIQRTNFFGYPHRRVPNELLLESEYYQYRSDTEDVFLILMMPISTKPYKKLIQMKEALETKYKEHETVTSEKERETINKVITNIHMQRQGLFRSFTGFLNKKRITKIQEQTDRYTLVYEHYKKQNPPVLDSMLKFIRTAQMDLRQHLILAKQYLAMEEKKLEV